MLTLRQAVVDGSAKGIAHIAHRIDLCFGGCATQWGWIVVLRRLPHVVDGGRVELGVEVTLHRGQVPPGDLLVVIVSHDSVVVLCVCSFLCVLC